MAYPKRELEVVPECNDEITGEPTCWAMKTGYSWEGEHMKPHFIWITKYGEQEYIIEDSDGANRADGKVFKTLWGAKRHAEGIAYRQDESGCFSD